MTRHAARRFPNAIHAIGSTRIWKCPCPILYLDNRQNRLRSQALEGGKQASVHGSRIADLTPSSQDAKQLDMARINSICVYCGSSNGANPIFVKSAAALGHIMAENDISLVYGGGSVGLMGAIAKAVMEGRGKVTGIIPKFLKERELLLEEVDEVIVTEDMHERKRLMFERSDAFVALPGGIGTLEELVEMLTWAQLGRHKKPVLMASIDGFWEPLLDLFAHMRDAKFISSGHGIEYLVADSVEDILPMLQSVAAMRSRDDLDQDMSRDPLARL